MNALSRLAALFLLCTQAPVVGSVNDSESSVRSRYEAGEYERAVAEAEASLNRSPDLLLYHGLALAQLTRYEEARAILQSGHKLYPDDKRFPLELAGVAYREERLDQARRFLGEALEIDPLDKYGNDFLGTLYLIEGDVAAALKHWNRIDKPLVQDVTVAPPPPLRPILRERAVAISGGQIFTLARLRATEANFDRMNIFARRTTELRSGSNGRFDVRIRLLPAGPPLRGWLGQLLPAARSLPYQAVHYDRTNIAQSAVNFRSLWRWDPNKRRIDWELAGPIRMNPRFRYRIGVDARDENWGLFEADSSATGWSQDLKLRKVAFEGDLLFALKEKLEWTTGLQFARRGFRNNNGAGIFADSWSFEQRNQLAYRLLDMPARRIRVDSRARLRTGRLFGGASSRFAVVEGDIEGAWNPRAQDGAWEARSRLRAGNTFGQIPFDMFFQLGMERDNDLWLRGHAGTREGKKGSAPLGTDYALLQTGLDRTVARLPFVQIRAGPFLDTGRISESSGRFGSGGWLLDAGIEATIVVAGGFKWSVVYGRDLRGGNGVFYTSVRY